MFIVYSGYASPDNCTRDGGPVCTLDLFDDEDEVLAHKKEFDEETEHDEISDIIYKVFRGTECKLKPFEKVTSWKIEH